MILFSQGNKKWPNKMVHIYLGDEKYCARNAIRRHVLSAEEFKEAYKKTEHLGWRYVGPLELGVWRD